MGFDSAPESDNSADRDPSIEGAREILFDDGLDPIPDAVEVESTEALMDALNMTATELEQYRVKNTTED